MPLDPVAREVVRNLDDEPIPGEGVRPRLAEPRVVGGLGEGVPQPPGYGVPEVVGSCLGGMLHPSSRFVGRREAASIAPFAARLNAPDERACG